MQFVYPQSMLEPLMPEEMFRAESHAMARAGNSLHLLDSELLTSGRARFKPPIDSGSKVVYRGWMLTYDEYVTFASFVERSEGTCFTSPDQYVATHYLPNWYAIVTDYTPETVIFERDVDLARELRQLGWGRFFVKDYVKSLKTSVGSIVERAEQIELVVSEMEKYRGFIEGGVCVRRVEDLIAETEQRYFVLNHIAFAADPGAPIPEPVAYCAREIDSPFFSVDIARRRDGVDRVVELGDGQVSDLVGWSVSRFIEIWRKAG